MARKLTPQGKTGRKTLTEKIAVECIEEGCHEIVYTNRGNASKGTRCPEHRRLRSNQRAGITHKAKRDQRRGREYDPKVDNNLNRLRGYRVLIKCRNEFCDNTIEVDGVTARNEKGVYCESCRKEAKRISDHNYDRGRRKLLREQQRLVANRRTPRG